MTENVWWVPRYDLPSGYARAKFFRSPSFTGVDLFDGWKIYKIGKDIFDTQESAAAQGRALRNKRRVSLMKQIKKLDALDATSGAETL